MNAKMSFVHQEFVSRAEVIVECEEIVVLLAEPLVGCDGYNDLQPLPRIKTSKQDLLTNVLPKQTYIEFRVATHECLKTVLCNHAAKSRILHLIMSW